MKRIDFQWIALLLLLVLCADVAIAANDPGHDSLYVLKLGDSNLTGSLNISSNLSAQLVRINEKIVGDYLDIVANGTILGTPSQPRIMAGTNSLYIDSTNGLYINTKGGTSGVVQIGDTATNGVTLNVSGAIKQQGVAVCLSNGTNCIGGSNTGNVSSVGAGSGLGNSGTANDPVLDVNVGDGLSISSDRIIINNATVCRSDGTGCPSIGGASSAGGWANTSTLVYGASNTTNLSFGNATATAPLLFLDNTGKKVGIGTRAPTQTLDVNGSINVSGASGTIYVGTKQVCLSDGTNCPASGAGSGNVSGAGNVGALAYWTNSTNIAASILNQSGNTLTLTGNLTISDTLDLRNAPSECPDGYYMTRFEGRNSTCRPSVGGNSSWNETRANSLYYGITNPNAYISDGNTNWDNSYNFIANGTDGSLNYLYAAGTNLTTTQIAEGSSLYYTNARVVNAIQNSTIARIGTCPAGQVVQNTTTSGVQCVAVSAGSSSGDGWINNSNAVYLYNNATNVSIGNMNSVPVFFIDNTNGRVGIGNSTPESPFVVQSNQSIVTMVVRNTNSSQTNDLFQVKDASNTKKLSVSYNGITSVSSLFSDSAINLYTSQYKVIINSNGIALHPDLAIRFSSSTNGADQTPDVGIARGGAGTINITDGSTGLGNLTASTINATAIYIGTTPVCRSDGTNCPASSGSGNVTGAGTAGTIAYWTNGTNLGNSILSQSGSTLMINGNISMQDNFWIGNSASATKTYALAIGTSANAINTSAIAIGQSASANGTDSVAIGDSAIVAGVSSIAIGLNAKANVTAAIAIGNGATANSTQQGVALGYIAKASADSSTAIGSTTTASGTSSIALGAGASATGFGSNAIGPYASASGTYAQAIGYQANAATNYAQAIGYQANAGTNYAQAIGYQANASFQDSIALGRGATTTSNNQLIIGNGSQVLNTIVYGYLNAYQLQVNGTNVCRSDGTNCPAVSGSSSAGGWTNSSNLVRLASNTTNVSMGNTTGSVPVLFVDSTSGNVGIGTGTPASQLTIVGNITDTMPSTYIYMPGDIVSGLLTPRCGCDTGTGLECGTTVFESTTDNGSVCYDQRTALSVSRQFFKANAGFKTLSNPDDSINASGFQYIDKKAAVRVGIAGISGAWNTTNIGLASVAMGYGTVASATYSTALGFSTIANGSIGATALGESTIASGTDGATALGTGTVASGNSGATALGEFAVASGTNGATALGHSTTASGAYGATALGSGTIAAGDSGATAVGSYTAATGTTSIAIGEGADGSNYLNNTVAHSLMIGFQSTTPTLFVNGSNVGIGTITPNQKLQVNGSINVSGAANITTDQGNSMCFNQNCSARIYYNGTALVIQG